MPILVDVHGSCVSRDCFNLLDQSRIKVQNYFSRNNIVSCMMPPADISFNHGELVKYDSEFAERTMRLALNKQTVPRLLESNAEYLVIDFYDFCHPVAAYFDTTFSTYDYCFYNTTAYREHKEQFNVVDFINIPICLWYGYVDRYFQLMMEKFNGKVILNRLDCSGIYLNQHNELKDVPDNKLPFGDPRYNQLLRDLENYVIDRYHPFVIDISKYFTPDERHIPDVTAVHFEKFYYTVQSDIILNYTTSPGDIERRYNDVLPLSVISSLLDRPVPDPVFSEIYSKRTLPFKSDTILDYFFQTQELDEVIKNRRFIASVYRQYNKAKADCESCREIVKRILDNSSIWKTHSTVKSTLISDAFNYLKYVALILENELPELYRSFLSDFQSGNVTDWIFKLNLLSVISPEYEDVPAYLTQFYQTVGDDYSLRKLLVNHSK